MGLRMLCTRIALRTSVFPNSRFNSARVEQDGSRVCLFCVPLDTPLPLCLRPPPHLHRDGGPCPSAECLRICLASCCPEWVGATPQLVVPVRPGGGRLVDVVDGTRSGAGARHSGPPLRPGSPQRSVTGLRVYGVPPTPPGPSEWMHLEPVFHAAIAGIIILPLPLPVLLVLPLVYPFHQGHTCGYLHLPSRRCCVCVPFLLFLFSQLNIVTLSSTQLAWLFTFFFFPGEKYS